MESYSVEAILSAVDKGFTDSMKKADDSLGGLDTKAQKSSTSIMDIAKGAGVFKLIDTGVGLVTSSLDGAISRVDTLNNSNRVFENMGFAAEETAETMDNLKESINGLPTPLDGAIKGVQLIASSTNDLKKSEQIFSALNNGILGFGGTTEMVDNAIVQLSQSFSNGKVDAQTWNSMINSGLGPALNALAKQMGITAGELKSGLSKGEISVNDFQDALIDLNKNGGGGLKSLEKIAQDSTSGIKTGIANMKTAVVRGVANIISSIDESLKNADLGGIGGIIATIGSTLEVVLKKVAEYVPIAIKGISMLIKIIKTIAPFLIPAVTAWAAFMIKLKGISTVIMIFGKLKAAITGVVTTMKILTAVAAANPFVIIVGAIVGLIAMFIYLWKTNEGFRDGVINIWNGIKNFFIATFESIKIIFTDLWTSMLTVITPFVDNFMAVFQPLITWFGELWNNIKIISAAAWELIKAVIMGPVLLLIDLVTGNFGKLKEDASMIWNTIKTSLSTIVKTMVDIVVGYYKALWDTIKNIFSAIKDVVINAGNNIKDGFTNAVSTMKDKVTGFIDGIVNVFNKIKDIDLLEAGKAIIDGFIKGLKQKWEDGKKFISGIGDWIRDHKGPISYDKRLLIPAGNAIINGLNKGLEQSFRHVKSTVDDMTSYFSNTDFGAGMSFDADLTSSISDASMSLNSNNELTLKNSKQPANIMLNIGGRVFSAFVEDISSELALATDLDLQN